MSFWKHTLLTAWRLTFYIKDICAADVSIVSFNSNAASGSLIHVMG